MHTARCIAHSSNMESTRDTMCVRVSGVATPRLFWKQLPKWSKNFNRHTNCQKNRPTSQSRHSAQSFAATLQSLRRIYFVYFANERGKKTQWQLGETMIHWIYDRFVRYEWLTRTDLSASNWLLMFFRAGPSMWQRIFNDLHNFRGVFRPNAEHLFEWAGFYWKLRWPPVVEMSPVCSGKKFIDLAYRLRSRSFSIAFSFSQHSNRMILCATPQTPSHQSR